MHLSQFNRYVKDNKDIIVYNNKFDSSIRFSNTNINDVKYMICNNRTDDFVKCGFLTDIDEEIETKNNYKRIKVDATNLMVSIIMTYSCNCSCEYCFEHLFRNIDEGEKRVHLVANYIAELYYLNRSKSLNINYFGGEPLNNLSDMFSLHDILTNHGINLEEHVTTNGTLLTKDTVKNLISRGIKNYQITLDGSKQIQDRRRPLKSRESSWDYIIDGIKNLLEEDSKIHIRINIDQDNMYNIANIFSELPDVILTSNKVSFYLAPVIGQNLDDFTVVMKKRAEIMIKAWNLIRENNLPIEIILPRYSPCSYDSAVTAFYIDLHGRIFSCGGDVGILESNEGVLSQRNEKYFSRINQELSNKCYKCSFFYKCMGGCHYETSINGENCQLAYFQKIYDNYYMSYKKIGRSYEKIFNENKIITGWYNFINICH